ncbi:MAG: hypothetical protein QOH55_480 [Microbacteriaceae bacterium]|nr:hypothetical protein [Microbacteriaceae bacterium]
MTHSIDAPEHGGAESGNGPAERNWNSTTRSRTAHEYVVRELRHSILEGRLPRGSRLRQVDLATQFDVSVTPVREALRDLAAEGLVVFDAHRGAMVRSLDLSEVHELYEIRMTLEPLMVRRCIPLITSAHIDEANRIRSIMEATEDVSAWVELNRQFHEVLADPGRGSRLATILASLRDSASSYVALSLSTSPLRVDEANTEHAELVEYYRRKDLDAVLRLTRQHLQTTLATIEDAYSENLEPVGESKHR